MDNLSCDCGGELKYIYGTRGVMCKKCGKETHDILVAWHKKALEKEAIIDGVCQYLRESHCDDPFYIIHILKGGGPDDYEN